MALTRPTIQNINTNLTTFTDSLTVTNFGNVANRDIGEVFDRSQGGGSNVAVFWQESTNSFRLAYTSSTGTEPGNLVVTSNANITLGNITAEQVITNQFISAGSFTASSLSTFSSGISVDQIISSNASPQIYSSAQTTIGIGGSGTTVSLSSTTPSIDTSTGALVVGGGIGIAGNAYVGGNLVVGGNILVANVIYENTEYISSTEVVAGNSTVNGLTVNTSATVGTTLSALAGIQNTPIGNASASTGTFTTVTATSSVNGPLNGTLGEAGGNTAIISTLTTTGNATVNALTVNSTAVIGSTLEVIGQLTTANIVPSANAVYTLGSPTQRFKSLYLSGNTVYMDGATISSNATAITFTNPQGGSFTIPGTSEFIASNDAELSQYVTEPIQSNITQVGTLSNLTVSGTFTGNAIYAANFGNNGANFTGAIFNAAGAFYGPLSGTLGADGANTAIVTTLTGTGNTTVNALTVNNSATFGSTVGIVGNLLVGNISTSAISATTVTGTFSGTASITSGSIIGLSGGTESNATIAAQTFRVAGGGAGIIGDSYISGNLGISQHLYVAGNSSVAGTTSISDISKLTIPGGTAGYVIKTDGSGTLSWQPDNSGGITYTANVAPPTFGNLTGDQWYNTTTDVLYEYSYDGQNYYWVDQSGAAFGDGSDPLSPFLLMGA